MGVGMESTELVDVVLSQGRRLELYMVDENATASTQARIDAAFLKAFNNGMFQVNQDVFWDEHARTHHII